MPMAHPAAEAEPRARVSGRHQAANRVTRCAGRVPSPPLVVDKASAACGTRPLVERRGGFRSPYFVLESAAIGRQADNGSNFVKVGTNGSNFVKVLRLRDMELGQTG